ncbi:hypothetical protein [Alistipes sp. An116]|uniref:hypothetical protein n=1 Tax=Alistipes sp. An116 TaxID=1965546 RepID=UPI0011786D6E|nr:hypothetical protein [Alistipes sp. An116]
MNNIRTFSNRKKASGSIGPTKQTVHNPHFSPRSRKKQLLNFIRHRERKKKLLLAVPLVALIFFLLQGFADINSSPVSSVRLHNPARDFGAVSTDTQTLIPNLRCGSSNPLASL